MKLPSTFHVIARDDRLGTGPWVFAVETPRPGEDTTHGAATRAKTRCDSLNRRAHAERTGQRFEVIEYVPRDDGGKRGCR